MKDEEVARAKEAKALLKRAEKLGCLCADGCYGRCRDCPQDVVDGLVAFVRAALDQHRARG